MSDGIRNKQLNRSLIEFCVSYSICVGLALGALTGLSVILAAAL